jgi:murein DD-endopeptidase MepM/ murein hydrolase activator NlpD
MPPRIPPRFPTAVAVLALLAALLPSVQAAPQDVYRWTDKDGNVHYSDHGGSPTARRVPVAVPDADPSSLADLEIVRSTSGEGSDVYVSNKLGGPLQVAVGLTEANNVSARPALPLRQLVPANQRVLVSRIQSVAEGLASYSVGMTAMPGDPTAMPEDVVYGLPVDEHSGWRLGQGFHGGFSHTDEQNKYAVDLIVDEGTPVLAARGGVVMQVESGFDRSGTAKKYAERANLIRVLHDDGTMGVYAHLKENGVYVRVGERVSVGQEIAESGNTGYSTGPHLHFAVQVNRGMRLESVPFRMLGGARFLPLPKQ